MWNLRSCVAMEVARGRHVAFMDSDSEDFLVTGVYGPLRIRGRGLF